MLSAATLALSVALTTGCGSGKPSRIETGLDAPVVHVEAGYWLPADAAGVLRIADPDARLAQWNRRAVRVDAGFLVPPATLEWLLKQAAELRRRDEAAP